MTQASPAKSRPADATQELMRAVDEANVGLVKSLLAAGADVNAVSEGGKSALIRATTRGYLDIVRVLLAAGADVNAKKENGATALIVAVFLGYADIVRVLLASGADPDAQTAQGTTAEKWAQSIGFTEIVALLRNAEAIRAEGLPVENAPPDAEQSLAAAQIPATEHAEAAEFFPSEGVFQPVVRLTEIDEPSLPEDVPAGQPIAAAGVEDIAEREADSDHSHGEAQTDHDETTIVPARFRAASPHRAPSHLLRAFQSRRVIVVSLVLLLISGIVLEARWRSSKRSAQVAEPVPLVKDAAPAADAPGQDAAPQAAPQSASQLPEAPRPTNALSTPASVDSTARARTNPETETETTDKTASVATPSKPSAPTESRRAPEAAPPARRPEAVEARTGRLSPPPVSEKENDIRAARQETRPSRRRTTNTTQQVQSSTSRDLSLPVVSPPPSADTGKGKVIQWP